MQKFVHVLRTSSGTGKKWKSEKEQKNDRDLHLYYLFCESIHTFIVQSLIIYTEIDDPSAGGMNTEHWTDDVRKNN